MRPKPGTCAWCSGSPRSWGIVGPIAAFGLFFLADRVFHLDHPRIQTMMYLMLSVAGHLTIFQTRTRGPFWSIRPARILWMAVLGTQMLATTIAVFGLLVTPIGWRWAAFVWGYALAWFFLTDPVKLLAYRIFDPANAQLRQVRRPRRRSKPKQWRLMPKPHRAANQKPKQSRSLKSSWNQNPKQKLSAGL